MRKENQTIYLDITAIGNNVRNLRRREVYSQAELAEAMDVSVMTISRIENGITPMNIVHLMRISEIFHVEVQRILTEKL